jgi:virginiamycin A acetyltransferase
LRLAVKRLLQGIFLIAAFPAAVLCGFGRVTVLWTLFSHYCAIWPGIVGNFLRAAFYRLTLEQCSQDVVIAFGTFFSRQQVTVEPNVSIGSYCVIGRARIGARTQISSHVEIPGGRLQHIRDAQGRLSDTQENSGPQVVIGEDCWVGAAAVVLANIGPRSTIGAGSVVTRDIPADVVAVGVPARPVKSSRTHADAQTEGTSASG